MHAKYVQVVSLLSVDWEGHNNSLLETHQHPFAVLNAKAETPSQPQPAQQITGRRQPTLKNPAQAWVWKQKCLQLGWGRGHLSCLPHAVGEATHPGHWAHRLCGPWTSRSASSMHCLSSLGGHWYLQGYCVTSYSHPNYTVSNKQWDSQSLSVGRHEKHQAWASSHNCPLTAVEPQTKISTVWVSDNVLHWKLYSVIFMGGKELKG